jgi:uncharacterized SAM-binding protein YcdF (DUF218 family)
MKYLMIPSNEVFPLNSLRKTFTEKRLTRGLKIWKQGKHDKIIVSGGIFLPPNVQTVAAGRLMEDWLRTRGVPADKITVEDKSRDTYENISESLSLVYKDVQPEITVVTHWQHALRFWVTFRRAHQMKVKTVPMFYWVDIKTFILEWIILLVHIFDRNGTGKIASKNRLDRTYPKKA